MTWRLRRRVSMGVVAAVAVGSSPLIGQGHGPVYGLSTPTLGRGGWSIDTAMMGRFVEGGEAIMVRPMFSHGLTEDLQLSVSVPVRLYATEGLRPIRGLTRMPMTPDAQLMLGWRFHRNGVAVGARWESTAWLALEAPTDAVRGGVETTPGLYGAVVTGYASRSWYAWAGGAYRRQLSGGDGATTRLGHVSMASLVIGYRPPAFRADYPRPDWRAFVELVSEWIGRDTILGETQRETGGHQVFAGLTALGLYGWWGVSGGPAIPVHQRANGQALRERLRFTINFTFWF